MLVPMPAERALYLCRAGRHARRCPARSCGCRSGRARSPASSGTAPVEAVDPKKLRPIDAGLRLPADRPSRCGASSTGSRTTRCRRPAWWRAWCCARRRPSTRSRGSRACSARDSEPDRMTAARDARARTGRRRACLDALRPGACRRRVVDRHRRAEGARRVRDGDDPAAAGGGGARPGLCRSRAERRPERGGRDAARPVSRPAHSASRCSTASPAPARPRSISRRSPRRSTRASRC